MSELPTGTVSLLFSDVEGSTALLSRLGPAYADALDGQRQVLRKAWAEHGGTELGTEGDSFYVVFSTAEGAVAAATQAQRELAAYEWPAGEQVRVRMGIHTGAPTPHDGAYVGMDVHRAARVAGAAYGGQVLLSSATAELVGSCLPAAVTVKNLGSHRLKDIPQPEHLFQLAIGGLRTDFPPPKTLGASSSLPRPATTLMGRDGELAELTALLGSPEVRLVTLTGPGGSGKTRLAVALAQGLVERFPDGIYFVPLAAVTTSDVMWTSIAEVLDVPPEGRIPPGFFDHVAHRSALFVLDNLEQIEGADGVVAELLDHAPQAVAIATSRKPLAVPAEHVHPVPPLELPNDDSLDQAQAAGAVQMFVQHARKVKPSFVLTADNAGDVTAVCVRLDGLPLAIELAAARTRLLTPKALLSRLDTALDIAAHGTQTPSRQKTLRDTIAWSYDLLSADRQRFFRWLGIFAGGADLDAIAVVTASDDEPAGSADPFDMVAELTDASLLTVTETPDGEPRIGMLETVRAYALDQFTAVGEFESARDRHAHHYVQLAEQWRSLLVGEDYIAARTLFDADHDNFREALRWTLQTQQADEGPDPRTGLALRLCGALGLFWSRSGYFLEWRRWLEQAIHRARGTDSPELAQCLIDIAEVADNLGDPHRSHEYATAAVAMCRRLQSVRLGKALRILAGVDVELGHVDAARPLLDEALVVARAGSDDALVMDCLFAYANLETCERNFERAEALNEDAILLARKVGDQVAVVVLEHNMACNRRLMGQAAQAKEMMSNSLGKILQLNQPGLLVAAAEDYAAILAELDEHHSAAQLLGAAEAMRDRLATPRPHTEQANITEAIAKIRAALNHAEWHASYEAGRNTTVEEALTHAQAASLD